MTKRLTKQRYLNQSRKSYFIFVPSMFILYLFDDEIYIQCDRVAMGSPLGSLLANIFMIALEEQTLPLLKNGIINWKRYVDETYAYIKPNKITHVLNILNSCHPKFQFTFEFEENNKISLLDVIIYHYCYFFIFS